jgi:SAM-dependent methyltransferase
MVRPNWRELRIWEVAPAGPASNKLRAECARYLASHYWPGVPPGGEVDGIRCEDIEHSTLVDGCMDVIITSDVFEHVIDADRALAEVARVLAVDGTHVWTAPQYRELESSRARVRRRGRGLEYLVPAEYHGDPVNADGALVTIDWGRDLPDRVESASGMSTVTFRIESRGHGLLGEFLEVFVSCRRGDEPIDAGVGEMGEALQRARAELEICSSTLAGVLSSKSWRLTSPVRSLGGIVRRLGGR